MLELLLNCPFDSYSYKQILFTKIEWVGNCCWTPTKQFFSYIMARTS